jgi:hypothetical protein
MVSAGKMLDKLVFAIAVVAAIIILLYLLTR